MNAWFIPGAVFVILPIFALVNAGMVLSVESMTNVLSSSVSQGIFFGLVVGKFFGITACSWIAVRLKFAFLPGGVSWPQILGTALLAGIGFTVSLFITGLSYQDRLLIADAKLGILGASLLARRAGLRFSQAGISTDSTSRGEYLICHRLQPVC